MGFVLAVEAPEAECKRGGVFRRERKEVLEEGIGAVLVQKRQQGRIADVRVGRRERADRSEKIIP
jgi:hypothetical protein